MFLLRLDQDSYTATIQVDESIKSRETCMLEDRKMAKFWIQLSAAAYLLNDLRSYEERSRRICNPF